mmetsp:Transcript_24244/g.31476  ORF Transcript_24244/g.31476 Transcript_24244/m.31476 type:complete len:527 (+) Transcript_24244:136-1716(+)
MVKLWDFLFVLGFFILGIKIWTDGYEVPQPCMLQRVIDRIDHWLEYENKKMNTKLIRLAAHDCMGGCDGCINLNNMDNNGLKSTVWDMDNLTDIIQNNFINMSRADIWALAEMRAVSSAMSNDDTEPNFIYKVGRKDCANGSAFDEYEDVFPDPANNLQGLMEEMPQFNFSKRELTALLGAHSVGNCKQANSGYEGEWAEDAERLSNDYYQLLLNSSVNWHQVLIKNIGVVGATGEEVGQKWQWNGTSFPDKLNGSAKHIMMLNVDMTLILDFAPNVTIGGEVDCNYTTCALQDDTYATVVEFANHKDTWIDEFSSVFMKLQEYGYYDGELTEIVTEWGNEWEDWEPIRGIDYYYMRTRNCVGATGYASCPYTDSLVLNQTVHGCCIGELSTKKCNKLAGTYNCTAYDNDEYDLGDDMGGLECENGYAVTNDDTTSSSDGTTSSSDDMDTDTDSTATETSVTVSETIADTSTSTDEITSSSDLDLDVETSESEESELSKATRDNRSKGMIVCFFTLLLTLSGVSTF